VISQFWPETPPRQANFPLRNAVMSGISLATVVVEASPRSGARIQARLSLGQGRPVLLAEALLKQPWARELATRPLTHVVASAAEVPALVDRLSASAPIA
jgi:DNA processing protein